MYCCSAATGTQSCLRRPARIWQVGTKVYLLLTSAIRSAAKMLGACWRSVSSLKAVALKLETSVSFMHVFPVPPTGFDPVCAGLVSPRPRALRHFRSGRRISRVRRCPTVEQRRREKRFRKDNERGTQNLVSNQNDSCLKHGLQVNWSNKILNECSAPEMQVRGIVHDWENQNSCRQFHRTRNS